MGLIFTYGSEKLGNGKIDDVDIYFYIVCE